MEHVRYLVILGLLGGDIAIRSTELVSEAPVLDISELERRAIRSLKAEDGDESSFEEARIIGVWEFEKDSDPGGVYWVFTSAWDTRGSESSAPFEVISNESITSYDQLMRWVQESADKSQMHIHQILSITKIKH